MQGERKNARCRDEGDVDNDGGVFDAGIWRESLVWLDISTERIVQYPLGMIFS
jgi:hypothetical protein